MRLQPSLVVFFRRGSRPRMLVFIALLAVLLLALVGLHLQARPTHASATLSFASHVDYPVGTPPTSVAVGDFNGDGKLDLAVATASSSGGTVGVLLGKGDGTFAPEVSFAVGAIPASVAVGDFNGDGKLDLAVANQNSASVSVLLGNGDGTFAPAVDYPVGNGPFSVAVGDFNGDGKLDLVTANFASNTVSVLLGNGDGTFAPAVDYPVGIGPFSVAVGDFNGDGKLDLVTLNKDLKDVSVLLGKGDGTFAPAVNYSFVACACIQKESMMVGDFNGDGKLDLVIAGEFFSDVRMALGNGDGTFQPATSFAVGGAPESVAVGDFNGDGKLDLAVATASSSGGTVGVLLGKGDGTFAPEVSFAVGGILPISVAVGDFNGDGKPDLVTANGDSNNVSVLLNTTRRDTTLTYTGDTTQDDHDQATLKAHLVDAAKGTPIAGRLVSLSMGSQSCPSGTMTDASGDASCPITVSQPAGSYPISASFAGDAQYLPSSASGTFIVTLEETTTQITTGPTIAVAGGHATLSAKLSEDGTTPIAGRTLSLTLGSHSCTTPPAPVTDASGNASCIVSGLNTTTNLGPQTETARFAGDAFYKPSSDTLNVIVFAFLDKGAFVIGDQSAAAGGTQTFWGAQWSKLNRLSGGSAPAPAAFNGFAEHPTPPVCGTPWSTDTGNSTPPPDGPLPSYMGVIVSGSISQSGSTISGDTAHMVVVKTDPGYAGNAGHAGTGTIVGQVC